jgi:hypothetical protein
VGKRLAGIVGFEDLMAGSRQHTSDPAALGRQGMG